MRVQSFHQSFIFTPYTDKVLRVYLSKYITININVLWRENQHEKQMVLESNRRDRAGLSGSLRGAAGCPTAAGGAVTQPAVQTQPVDPTASGNAAIPVTSTDSAVTPSAAAENPQALPGATQPAANQPGAIDCASPAALTPAMTEGPYFKAGSPEMKDLAGSLPGTKLHLSGYVLTADCQPVANAKIDFWQADSQGQYDNSGYTLRGYQLTGADGSYQLTTVVPGEYPGRTEHIHVKVQAPGGPELTTQLFFPGVAHNDTDGIFDPSLLVSVVSDQGEMTATYNFVVAGQ